MPKRLQRRAEGWDRGRAAPNRYRRGGPDLANLGRRRDGRDELHLVFAVFAALFGLLLLRTTFGQRVHAIGNNSVAARFSGVRVQRTRLIVSCLTGLMYGLAGILLTSRVGSRGNIVGVILGIFLLGFPKFRMGLINVPGTLRNMFSGVLLILAILLPGCVARVPESVPGLVVRADPCALWRQSRPDAPRSLPRVAVAPFVKRSVCVSQVGVGKDCAGCAQVLSAHPLTTQATRPPEPIPAAPPRAPAPGRRPCHR